MKEKVFGLKLRCKCKCKYNGGANVDIWMRVVGST